MPGTMAGAGWIVELRAMQESGANCVREGPHDGDMDAMVTKNWTGYIPKEGLGFFAGVTILRGAPTFQQAKITFTINEMIKVSIADPAVAEDLVKNRAVK